MSDLHALLARIEAAEGPDRELDAAIEACFYTLQNDAPAEIVCDSDCAHNGHYWVKIDGGRSLYAASALTSSLDAAVSLCERCGYRIYTVDAPTPISGYTVMLVSIEKRRLNAELGHDDIGWLYVGASHAAFPLALCAAVVKAEIERRGEKP